METTDDVSGRERAAQWVLWSRRGVGSKAIRALAGPRGVAELWELGEVDLARRLDESPLGTKCARRLKDDVLDGPGPEEAFAREVEALPVDTDVLHVDDARYPERLHILEDPPTFLYVRGDLQACAAPHTISVVGSRQIGVEDARRAGGIVRQLAEAGLVVVSGGALGTDAVAHQACLDAGRQTVAVLPGGVDRPTPRSNAAIFREAAEQGALVSEYPLGVNVRAYHFPRRNRLIAALGQATFVVRGDLDSGTMLTADAAGELQRPVCALLGGLEEPLAQGCLELVVRGARGVRDAEDILETVFEGSVSSQSENDGATGGGGRHERRPSGAPPLPEGLSEAARQFAEDAETLFEEGGERVLEMEAAAEGLEREAAELQTLLLELELHGVAEKRPGRQAYRLRCWRE